MKLVWTSTGDEINIVPYNQELNQYWLDSTKQAAIDQFRLESTPPTYRVTQLVDDVAYCQRILNKVSMSLPTGDPFVQEYLNELHRVYVLLQRKHNLVELFKRVDGDTGVAAWRRINGLVHHTERTVVYVYSGSRTNWSVPNIHGDSVLEFGRWQIEFEYESLGRSTYEKWLNFDQLTGDDTDDYGHLGSRIEFNIGRTLIHTAPAEYLSACETAKVKPRGETIPFGNFATDLGTVRKLFYKNAQVADNHLTFVGK